MRETGPRRRLRRAVELAVPLTASSTLAALGFLEAGWGPAVAALLVGPLLACLRLDAIRTLATLCWSALLALASGTAGPWPLGRPYAVEYAALLVGGAVAVRVAARATSNATALARATEAARVAQAAILRPVSTRVGGIDVCTRHHCPVRESSLGGDVYDVALTPFGPRVFIADVRGHGLEEMRVSAAAVGAFRDLAYTVTELGELVRELNVVLADHLGPEDFVTAVFAEFGPGELRMVNCGHPAPLRIGTQVKFLEPAQASTPLGLDPAPEQRLFWLQPGDRVLFYTDGLVEARDASGADYPLADRADRVLAALLPDEALDALYADVTSYAAAPLTDDVALVLCEQTESPLTLPTWPQPRTRSTHGHQ
ncbi:PP2C family protein-serine/threonine phosphatase [Streptomyces sp. BYX5S]